MPQLNLRPIGIVRQGDDIVGTFIMCLVSVSAKFVRLSNIPQGSYIFRHLRSSSSDYFSISMQLPERVWESRQQQIISELQFNIKTALRLLIAEADRSYDIDVTVSFIHPDRIGVVVHTWNEQPNRVTDAIELGLRRLAGSSYSNGTVLLHREPATISNILTQVNDSVNMLAVAVHLHTSGSVRISLFRIIRSDTVSVSLSVPNDQSVSPRDLIDRCIAAANKISPFQIEHLVEHLARSHDGCTFYVKITPREVTPTTFLEFPESVRSLPKMRHDPIPSVAEVLTELLSNNEHNFLVKLMLDEAERCSQAFTAACSVGDPEQRDVAVMQTASLLETYFKIFPGGEQFVFDKLEEELLKSADHLLQHDAHLKQLRDATQTANESVKPYVAFKRRAFV